MQVVAADNWVVFADVVRAGDMCETVTASATTPF